MMENNSTSFDNDQPPFFNGFRHGWGHHSSRMHRGDITPIILHLLKEKPMHGYEIIRCLEEKSHGFWRPSAGSIYPTLQMLEEQDLIKGKDDNGKKVYTLTEAGEQRAGQSPFHDLPPQFREKVKHGHRGFAFREIIRRLFPTVMSIVHHGSDEDLAAAKNVLSKAADELEAIAKKTKN